MTVAELIKELQGIENQQRIVILSSDSEGNSYSQLQANSINTCAADISDSWTVEIGLEELTDTAKNKFYTEEDVMEDGIPAIVIYP